MKNVVGLFVCFFFLSILILLKKGLKRKLKLPIMCLTHSGLRVLSFTLCATQHFEEWLSYIPLLAMTGCLKTLFFVTFLKFKLLLPFLDSAWKNAFCISTNKPSCDSLHRLMDFEKALSIFYFSIVNLFILTLIQTWSAPFISSRKLCSSSRVKLP